MSVFASSPQLLYREINLRDSQQQLLTSGSFFFQQRNPGSPSFDGVNRDCKRIPRRDEVRVKAFWSDLSKATAIEMEPINDSAQLDQILIQAQQLSQPLIIDWMAAWCRKCIYLKPKLEKLAADYQTKMKFYYVDVNKVPQTLVKRGNISKMPTIQLWKDGEMKAEVIGGHKAWLVIEEVREMIDKFV